MREITVFPTNLMDWRLVALLLPEVRLILSCGLWGGRYTNMIGVAEIPLLPLAASLGLDPSVLASGIKVLCNQGLIVGDWETGEFFIVAWFRYHQFKNAGISMAKQQSAKIRSATVRNAVLKAAPWLGELKLVQSKQKGNPPTAATKVTSSAEKVRIRRASGIVTYLPTDPERAEAIESSYSSEQILDAVGVIEGGGKEPVPGVVQKEIERQLNRAEQEQLQSEQEEIAKTRASKSATPIATRFRSPFEVDGEGETEVSQPTQLSIAIFKNSDGKTRHTSLLPLVLGFHGFLEPAFAQPKVLVVIQRGQS